MGATAAVQPGWGPASCICCRKPLAAAVHHVPALLSNCSLPCALQAPPRCQQSSTASSTPSRIWTSGRMVRGAVGLAGERRPRLAEQSRPRNATSTGPSLLLC